MSFEEIDLVRAVTLDPARPGHQLVDQFQVKRQCHDCASAVNIILQV